MKLTIGAAVFEVASFAEASAAWCKTRDENGWGTSDAPPVKLRDGKKRYAVSYNGRVWVDVPWRPEHEPVYDPVYDRLTKGANPTSFTRLNELGFVLESTGGNCTAYIKEIESPHVDNGPQILITSAEADAQVPEREDEPILVGFYDVTNDKIAQLKFKNLAAFIESWDLS